MHGVVPPQVQDPALPLLNLIRFFSAQLSSLSRSCWMAAQLLVYLPHLPVFHLLGWRGGQWFPNHRGQKVLWESFSQLGFLRSRYFPHAQPNTSLNSTDYTPLWKGNLHLTHYVPSGPLKEHRSYAAWSSFWHFTLLYFRRLLFLYIKCITLDW